MSKKYGKHYFYRMGQIDKDLDGYRNPPRYSVGIYWPDWAKYAYKQGYGYYCSPEKRAMEKSIDRFARGTY